MGTKEAKRADLAPDSFEAEFYRRLDSIIERGSVVGLTLTHICREAGIARATPDRWEKNAPLTVRLIDKIEGIVKRSEAGAHKEEARV